MQAMNHKTQVQTIKYWDKAKDIEKKEEERRNQEMQQAIRRVSLRVQFKAPPGANIFDAEEEKLTPRTKQK